LRKSAPSLAGFALSLLRVSAIRATIAYRKWHGHPPGVHSPSPLRRAESAGASAVYRTEEARHFTRGRTNMMIERRTAADYAESAQRERLSARLQVLHITHDRDIPADEVIARAEAYFAFVGEEGEA
jgi:hypothetical protein